MLVQMGVPPDEATLLAVMTSGPGAGDMAQLLPLLMMMGEGNKDPGDILGGILLMRTLSGAGSQPASQLWFREGENLFIAENGVLYRINVATMTVEGQLAYRQGAGGVNIMTLLMPIFARAREKAQQASCLSNLKQLAAGCLMYAQDHDETMPTETWVKDILPYVQNEAVFACPSRPNLKIAYALNEEVLGLSLARIARPAETVLLFESNMGGDSPVGGARDLPEGGVHNGGVNLAYVDGHSKWVRLDEARKQLERPVE